MTRFSGQRRTNHSRGIWALCIVFILCAGLFVVGVMITGNATAKNQKATLEEAINRDVTACYAQEGRYPTDLAEIQEMFGLVYDQKHLMVRYELRGANIRPSITVIEREDR